MWKQESSVTWYAWVCFPFIIMDVPRIGDGILLSDGSTTIATAMNSRPSLPSSIVMSTRCDKHVWTVHLFWTCSTLCLEHHCQIYMFVNFTMIKNIILVQYIHNMSLTVFYAVLEDTHPHLKRVPVRWKGKIREICMRIIWKGNRELLETKLCGER